MITNPRSLVPADAPISLRQATPLRGQIKLTHALDAFQIRVRHRVALDAGAAAGGFTKALLDYGAERVYAVDVGHGQLLGSLRQDDRVVNLEKTNIADLTVELVPDVVEVVTLDLSYLSLREAIPQLESVQLAPDCDLLALVKPQFELGLAQPPDHPSHLTEALQQAVEGIERTRWRVIGSVESPVAGARGAIEFVVHGQRNGPGRG